MRVTRRKWFPRTESRQLPERDEPTVADVADYNKRTANVNEKKRTLVT